jgi:integrase
VGAITQRGRAQHRKVAADLVTSGGGTCSDSGRHGATHRGAAARAEIYHLREPQKIPLVMSPDETKRLLAVASSLKARILLGLGYGCGLRASEVVRLKVKHIDSAQKIIRVEQSKGHKDRNVMLSAETLDLLRQCGRCAHRVMTPERRGRNAGYFPAPSAARRCRPANSAGYSTRRRMRRGSGRG